MEENRQEEIREYLAKIRKTIADSQALVAQADLRLQETDRFLASQGLTREQVRKFRFTKEQRLLVNEELRRRGLPPIEDDDLAHDFDAATAAVRASQLETGGDSAASGEDIVAERRRKFGTFMQEYKL